MNDKAWNKNARHPMQSWEWGEFRQKMGNKISRIEGDNKYLVVWSKLYFLPWWFGYMPMGPVPTERDLEMIRHEALRMKAIGVRMEPCALRASITNYQFSIFNQMEPGRHLFKPRTLWINLNLSEEQLLAKMHPKTRYNIRLAEKRGVRAKEDPQAVEDYLKLMFGKTTRRQKIYSHSENYHRRLASLPFVHMFKAEHEGKIIAAWMIFEWENTAYYAYGAFDDDYRSVMAPVLGLWTIIKWAKEKGLEWFDLWGDEGGKGYSRFKQQFGPESIEMAGTFDLPVKRARYRLFRLSEELRWIILRLIK